MKNSIQTIRFKKDRISITLALKSVPRNTRDIPRAIRTLQEELPSIFTNECYNGSGKTFYEEVKRTETAHLFEHILLETMCLIKLQSVDSAEYNGRTYWKKNINSNIFTICLKVPSADRPIFFNALTKSVTLVNKMVTTISTD